MSHGNLKLIAVLCSCLAGLTACGGSSTGTASASATSSLDGAIPQCDELLSAARKEYRTSAKTACDSSRTIQEMQNNVGCLIQQRVDRCESKKWGSGKGGLDLSLPKK
jgi:hypothetical protein